MPDLFTEVDSAREEMFRSIQALYIKNPNHELLQFWVPGERICKNWPGMVERFWDHTRGTVGEQKTGIVQLAVFMRYNFALQGALKE